MKPDNLIKAIEIGVLLDVDKHPPFREMLKDRHKAYQCFANWVVKNLKGAADIVTVLGEFVQKDIHAVLYQEANLRRPDVKTSKRP